MILMEYNKAVERIAAGGRFSHWSTPLAAAIAHFGRYSSGASQTEIP